MSLSVFPHAPPSPKARTHARLPRAAETLLVASTGGHLAQLVLAADLLGLHPDSHWVTFDSPQSRSLLHDRRVTYVPYVRPRGFVEAARAFPTMDRLLRSRGFDAVLSTGAAVAAPALGAAVLHRVPAFYLESVSRFDGPSLTGRAMARTPGVHCFTQHEHWADSTWSYDVSVLDRLRSAGRSQSSGTVSAPRVFVTLGTISPYRFDALIDRLLTALPPDAQVTWQTGCSTRHDLPGRVHELVTSDQFDLLATEADIVISHAGVGSALRLLELGVRPVIVPRRAFRGEHVDDHQVQAARELARQGLADVYEADALSPTALGLVAQV